MKTGAGHLRTIPVALTAKLMSLTWTSSGFHLPKSLISTVGGSAAAVAASAQSSVGVVITMATDRTCEMPSSLWQQIGPECVDHHYGNIGHTTATVNLCIGHRQTLPLLCLLIPYPCSKFVHIAMGFGSGVFSHIPEKA